MSDLQANVEKNLKELNGLNKAVREYGEKALAAMEKKIGQRPDAEDAQALVTYYDNVLVMVRRAQGKLVESITTASNKSSEKKGDVSAEEKWLFFHRYEQYVIALNAEAASRI